MQNLIATCFLVFCSLNIFGQSSFNNDRFYLSTYGGLRISAFPDQNIPDLEVNYNQTSMAGLNMGSVLFNKFVLKASFQYNIESMEIYHKENFYDGYGYYDLSKSVRVLQAGKEYLKFRNSFTEVGLGIGYRWNFGRLNFAPFVAGQMIFREKVFKRSRQGKEIGTNNIRTWTTGIQPSKRELIWTTGVDCLLRVSNSFGIFSSLGYINDKTKMTYDVEITDILYSPSSKSYSLEVDRRGVFVTLGFYVSVK